jgi:hypothetical protein
MLRPSILRTSEENMGRFGFVRFATAMAAVPAAHGIHKEDEKHPRGNGELAVIQRRKLAQLRCERGSKES